MENKYSNKLIIMHWLLAALIIGVLLFGSIVVANLDNAHSLKPTVLRMHMLSGALIFVLMLWRLLLRFSSFIPASANQQNKILESLASVVHGLLYVLVILLAISGFRLAFQADLWSLYTFAAINLPSTFADFSARAIHGNLAYILILFIVVHIAGFIYHQFIIKDNLIDRMRRSK